MTTNKEGADDNIHSLTKAQPTKNSPAPQSTVPAISWNNKSVKLDGPKSEIDDGLGEAHHVA